VHPPGHHTTPPKDTAMPNMQQNSDGSWTPTEPIGWQEEHGAMARFILWARGVGHCGQPGRRDMRAGVQAQADRADSAEARALELEAALSELTRTVGTCRQHIYVDAGMLSRLNAGSSRTIRAPHDQDPRVQSALTEARRVLRRAL
jgi:hypothetical protein